MHCLCCGDPLRKGQILYCDDCQAKVDAETEKLTAGKRIRRGA